MKNEGRMENLDEYRSFIGRILYYTIKITPECLNSVRELSQHMSNPGKEHWDSMKRFMGYLKSKKSHEIYYRPPMEYRSISFTDANYATNIEHRRSVTGIVNTIGGMISNWMSKTQTTVTLSSTEAEYIALSTCAQETIFQNQLLTELGNCMNPGVIKEDSKGQYFWLRISK